MATQIFDSKHSVLLEPQTHAEPDAGQNKSEHPGGAFRGFLYAMLFNVFLVAVGAGIWELWRLLR